MCAVSRAKQDEITRKYGARNKEYRSSVWQHVLMKRSTKGVYSEGTEKEQEKGEIGNLNPEES